MGIEPGKSKLAAVSEFPIPRNVRELRGFIGLTSYFRRFIKDYALITSSLTDMLKKDRIFEWTEQQNKAFNKIKKVLASSPVLGIYNPGAELEVHTDASMVGLAAVLYQTESEVSRPIAYYSRKTSPEESKYPSVELEVLAIVVALEKFRVYLLGKQFVVRTDCNCIKMLANKKDINSRIGRWFIRLAEFTFTVEYIKGSSNLVADALSRNPVNEAEEVGCEQPSIVMGININTDWVAALQRTDSEIMKLREALEQGNPESHQKFTMYNARVYKNTKNKWRLYVPESLLYDVIRDAHESVAHQGIDKTVEKLKSTYYFPKMRDKVSKYVNRCIKCIYYKDFSGKRSGFLHPLDKGTEPMTTIHYDHVGPYVTTRNKNKYVGVIVDGFSKFVVLGAMTDVSAEKTISLLSTFIANYGRPIRVITDRGTAFTSKLFTKFCERLEIQHIKVASGCPRSNGQVERVNKTITTSLAMLSEGVECGNWDERLLEVQVAINNTVHRVTKKTPAELIFRNSFHNLKDNALVREIAEINRSILPDEGSGIEEVANLLKENKEVIKVQYDKKRKQPMELNIGDVVMLRSDNPSTGGSRKLLPNFKGPYEVVKNIGNDRYLIGDIEGEKQSERIFKAIVAIDRLKLVSRMNRSE